MSWQHDREHYRIQYPAAARPRLVVNGVTYEVLDLSEGGLRVQLPADAPAPAPDTELGGVLRFRRDDEIVVVRGRVLRTDERHVAIRLEIGLGFRVVLDEQRYLLENDFGRTR